MSSEQIISTANRLYEMRRALRALFGERYTEVVSPYGKTIRHVATQRGISEVEAAIQMATEMKKVNPDPVITMCLMAAAVDLVEPSH